MMMMTFWRMCFAIKCLGLINSLQFISGDWISKIVLHKITWQIREKWARLSAAIKSWREKKSISSHLSLASISLTHTHTLSILTKYCFTLIWFLGQIFFWFDAFPSRFVPFSSKFKSIWKFGCRKFIQIIWFEIENLFKDQKRKKLLFLVIVFFFDDLTTRKDLISFLLK